MIQGLRICFLACLAFNSVHEAAFRRACLHCFGEEHVLCRDDTYLLHLEAMNLLLVLLSTQLYSPSAASEPGAHPFTEVLTNSSATCFGEIFLEFLLADLPPWNVSDFVGPANSKFLANSATCDL